MELKSTSVAYLLLLSLTSGIALAATADKTVVDDLIEKHNEAGKQITAFVEHVNDGFEKVGEHLNTLADEKADKTALDAKADKVELAKKANQADVDTSLALKADKSALEAKVDKSKFDSLKTDFSQLSTKVGELSTRVDANTARLAQLDGRITGVQKEMRRGFASQAALAGLFQPYNVGKVNVTAALGGYKSHTSLAVGAGYRFNQKVAAKAGLAVSTRGGSLSYNVAVNYEF